MTTSADAERLDEEDPLAHCRERFELPAGRIYLDGNSLGPLPRAVRKRLDQVVSVEWGQDLIASWNEHDWIDMPLRVGDRIGKLIGAAPGQVICADSISVNLFKVLAAALDVTRGRSKVLSIEGNFPTDLYMVEGFQHLVGAEQCRLETVPHHELIEAIDDNTAAVLVTDVDFRSGRRHDTAAIARAAHDRGAVLIRDLAHSAGAMPIELDAEECDFAVGCGYKFLNGGPGSPAFVYVAERHQHTRQPLAGWMGHARPFDFSPSYEPAPGIARFASGTPGILGMATLESALTAFDGVDLDDVRQKSLALADLFADCVAAAPELSAIELVTPTDPHCRGSQVSFSHPDGYAIVQAMIAEGVVGDFRSPDILRFGMTPLFTRYVEIVETAETMRRVVAGERHRDPEFQRRGRVT